MIMIKSSEHFGFHGDPGGNFSRSGHKTGNDVTHSCSRTRKLGSSCHQSKSGLAGLRSAQRLAAKLAELRAQAGKLLPAEEQYAALSLVLRGEWHFPGSLDEFDDTSRSQPRNIETKTALHVFEKLWEDATKASCRV